MSNRIRTRIGAAAIAAALTALLLSGCGLLDNAPAEQESAKAVASPPVASSEAVAKKSATATSATGDAIEQELTIEEISGGWKVARIEGAKPGSADANMTGAIAEIYPESASWSYKPKGAGALDDFCQEPVAGIVSSDAARRAVKNRFAKGGKPIANSAVPHELMCGGGGQFGDSEGAGTDIALIGPNEMAMTWDNGTVLILQRMDRPAPNEDMKPEDYRASDYEHE